MKCLFTKIQSNIAIWQYIAIHSNAICNMALIHIVSPLIHSLYQYWDLILAAVSVLNMYIVHDLNSLDTYTLCTVHEQHSLVTRHGRQTTHVLLLMCCTVYGKTSMGKNFSILSRKQLLVVKHSLQHFCRLILLIDKAMICWKRYAVE